jgi:cytochrome bd-type quinol oxidase subunit 1
MTSALKYKIAGMALLLLPLGILLLFTIGEAVSGDVEGLQHLVQAAPLVLLAVAAWRWPTPIGAILIAVGIGLGVVYVVIARENFHWLTIVLVEAQLFLPAIVAGSVFVLAGRRQGQAQPSFGLTEARR